MNALLSPWFERISRHCTSGRPASIIVANWRMKTTSSCDGDRRAEAELERSGLLADRDRVEILGLQALGDGLPVVGVHHAFAHLAGARACLPSPLSHDPPRSCGQCSRGRSKGSKLRIVRVRRCAANDRCRASLQLATRSRARRRRRSLSCRAIRVEQQIRIGRGRCAGSASADVDRLRSGGGGRAIAVRASRRGGRRGSGFAAPCRDGSAETARRLRARSAGCGSVGAAAAGYRGLAGDGRGRVGAGAGRLVRRCGRPALGRWQRA